MLDRKQMQLEEEKDTRVQIKNITEELLKKLTDLNGEATDDLSQPSIRESDTSSAKDEKDIHYKLSKILNILNQKRETEEEQEKEIVDLNELQIALANSSQSHF